MLLKKINIYFMSLVFISNLILAEDSDNNLQYAEKNEQKHNEREIFNIDAVLANPDIKEIYDSLSEKDKEEFVFLIKELNLVSDNILSKLVEILGKYETIIVKYKDSLNKNSLELTLAFTLLEKLDLHKNTFNENFDNFCKSIKEDEQNEFKLLITELDEYFKTSLYQISDVFNKHHNIKDKLRNLKDKEILLVFGFNNNYDALPCQYLYI